ncbi:Uma2 family endonuclease [Actinokineospora diospyrosa]|uniref:Restriction endonuclease n=1 Tax=Actinokineospora diospyrosa TaxID=103728 RepID=A0ABT1I5P4_9PSEU|nr:Uma2 family endonuclease [Actinokineospora diospyrosa]MCP2267932.1 putative restriction endonuclease [Actinokineospora diospyrosa]
MGPRVLHQLVASRLHELLSKVSPPELLVMADLAIDHKPRYQRDISVVHKLKINLALRAVPPEVVKLAVEIVSPSSRRRDWVEKRREYARMGIPNYLLVELTGIDSPCVYYHRLIDGTYQLASKAKTGEMIRIDDPVVVEFDPADLIYID